MRYSIFYVALLCALFTIIVYYPGYMSPDSVAQLTQARHGVNSNVYPPLMDYIWSVTDKILPGPAGMLILHNVVFWLALALISFAVLARTLLRLVFVLLAGFWPPTYGSIGTVWKDVGMQVFLIAALAMLFYAHYKRRIWPLNLAALCLFIAAGYRHNGLAAAVPVFALIVLEAAGLASECCPRLDRFLRKRDAVAAFYVTVYVLGTGVMLAGLNFVNTYRMRDIRLWSGALVHDLVAISVQQDKKFVPQYLDPDNEISVADMKGMYSPLHVNALIDPGCRRLLGIQNPSPKRFQSRLLTDEQARDLQGRWFQVVLDNVGSYLHHRLTMMSVLLVFDTGHPWYPYISGIDANPFGLTFKPSRLNTIVMTLIQAAAFRTMLYSAWVYYGIVMACFVISFLWDFGYARIVQVLAISTYLYFLSIFIFGMSGDFRYNIWALSCAYICPFLLGAGRVRRSAAEARAIDKVEEITTAPHVSKHRKSGDQKHHA